MKNGTLIVLEGLDGSGKATQAQLLAERMEKAGVQVRKVSFPNYNSDSSALVKMYLRGVFGTHADDVNPYAASAFYTVDRYASYRSDWGELYDGGGVVVADRYTTSNAVHQCAKLAPQHWEEYLQWLFDFEYQKIGIPAPDLVIYLDVDPAVSQQLMHRRYQGQDERKDIHERDTAYQMQSRQSALYCARKLGWQLLPCCRNGRMRSREEIHEEIWNLTDVLLSGKRVCK